MQGWVDIGFVARAHGIRGEVAVGLHHDGDSITVGMELRIREQVHAVEAARAARGMFLVRLSGVPDRTAAEGLRGSSVAARRDALAKPDEVLLADLVGCEAVLEDGTHFGTVDGIEAGIQDRLVIVDGGREYLLPVVDAFISDIDVENKRVVVSPPDELPFHDRS